MYKKFFQTSVILGFVLAVPLASEAVKTAKAPTPDDWCERTVYRSDLRTTSDDDQWKEWYLTVPDSSGDRFWMVQWRGDGSKRPERATVASVSVIPAPPENPRFKTGDMLVVEYTNLEPGISALRAYTYGRKSGAWKADPNTTGGFMQTQFPSRRW